MDRFEISDLRSYYGALLTNKQDDMLRMRYDEDMSFGEIAEALGVSRPRRANRRQRRACCGQRNKKNYGGMRYGAV